MKLYSRQNNITHFVTSKFDGTPCEGKLSRTVWCGGKSGDDVKGLPIAIVIKSKRAEGYIGTTIMILIACIVIGIIMSLLTAVNIARISKRNTYKVIDGFVTLNSIEIFNSIKSGHDYTTVIDKDSFREYFCQYNDLTDGGATLTAYTADGDIKYTIKNLDISFIKKNSLKLQVDYTLEIPLSFGDFTMFKSTVPITVKSRYTNKFS